MLQPISFELAQADRFTVQHDPEDEPVVTPLSPTYFEFDRKHS